MRSARIPGGTWGWRRTGLVLVVVVAPVVALGLVAPGGAVLADMARFAGVVVSAAVLVSAIASYAAWRVNPRPGLAWMAFAVSMLGCQGLLLAALQLGRVSTPVNDFWLLATDSTVALAVLCCALLADRVALRPDPVAAGFVVGSAVELLRLVWITRDPGFGERAPAVVPAIPFALVLLAIPVAIVRMASLPPWARLRIAVTVLLLGGAHLALYLSDTAPVHLTAVVSYTAGSVVLVSTCLALFFAEVQVDDASRSMLNDELEAAKNRLRLSRAQLHEINSTVAGIASASRLLRSDHPISPQRRRTLEDMVFAEVGRLERLMAQPVAVPKPRTVDLDETIRTLVVSHEARGRRVRWTPSGERVTAQPDAVAEVINILLDNAAKHGLTSAEVSVSKRGEALEIAVHDDGPGVDARLRHRLFDWGARGPRSTGNGIGLHIAQELMQQQGGYLEVRDAGRGATFVMGLPIDADQRNRPEDDGDEPPTAADLA